MDLDFFIAAALRHQGIDVGRAHNVGIDRELRNACRFVGDLAPRIEHPGPCHVRVVGYLVNPMNAMRWRMFDLDGYPPAAKVPAVMDLWCARAPRWSADYAYRAFLKVEPFGLDTGLAALVVYQWLRRSWYDPVLPPGDGSHSS